MKSLKLIVPCFSLILLSCSTDQRKKHSTKPAKYTMSYSHGAESACLVVFDNNDTIYVNDYNSKDLNDYTKIVSDREIISKITKSIKQQLQPKNLLISNDHVTCSTGGTMTISIVCGSTSIETVQQDLANRHVSQNISVLTAFLEKEYTEIGKLFK